MEWDCIVGRGGGAVGSHFSQSFVCPLQKHFLLSLTSITPFSSSWALTFRISSLHTWTMSPCSSQVTCPWFHVFYASFLCLSLEVLLIHPKRSPGILPDFLHMFPGPPLPSRDLFCGGPAKVFEETHFVLSSLGKKSWAVKSNECCLLYAASSEL